MMLKGTVAFLLALVFQLAQLPDAPAFQTACKDGPALHCECCEGLQSCPCAEGGDNGPERPLLPVLPEAAKLPSATLCETRVTLEDAPVEQAIRRVHAASAAGPITAYAGVSLAVAYCSYLM
jgi:hypothetical protein